MAAVCKSKGNPKRTITAVEQEKKSQKKMNAVPKIVSDKQIFFCCCFFLKGWKG
jgi:hypothetical protein